MATIRPVEAELVSVQTVRREAMNVAVATRSTNDELTTELIGRAEAIYQWFTKSHE